MFSRKRPLTEGVLFFGRAPRCFGLVDAAASGAYEDVQDHLLCRNESRSGPCHLDVTASAYWRCQLLYRLSEYIHLRCHFSAGSYLNFVSEAAIPVNWPGHPSASPFRPVALSSTIHPVL